MLKKFNEYISEAAPTAPGTSTAPAAPAKPDAQTMQQNTAAYAQNKGKVDNLFRNATLVDNEDALQQEFDKLVGDAPNKDLINIYFAAKKMEAKKAKMEAEIKQMNVQIQQKMQELKTAEANLK